jgi:Spx/MgsR family transcriptional regulator
VTPVLYGIPNCDTVKRARAWFAAQGLAPRFHDFKKQGVPEPELARWIARLGWEALLNRQGTTWRKLDDAVRSSVTDAASAAALMRTQPSVIRRPVVDWGPDRLTVGFDPARWPPPPG